MDATRTGRRAFLAGAAACVASLSGCMDADWTGSRSVRRSPDGGGVAVDGTFHDSLVLFRNDDPVPWTGLDVLRSVNDVFAERNVPLTHSIVTRDTTQDEELEPAHPVCQYFADERGDRVGFAVHGRTHDEETEFHGDSELGGLPGDEQRRRIEAAVETLDGCLDASPLVFVPPLNSTTNTPSMCCERPASRSSPGARTSTRVLRQARLLAGRRPSSPPGEPLHGGLGHRLLRW